MYRFFVEKRQIGETQVQICGTDVNHIKNVLRMKVGEEIFVSCGENQVYHCHIASMEEEQVLADIVSVEEAGFELPSKIYLFQGLPKSDKMELIIQKAVELGVCEIIPVATKRAVVKLDAKKEAAKLRRWQAIAESAAKQSKRMYVPEIKEVLSFAEALSYAKSLDVRIIPYELASGMEHTRKLLTDIKAGQSIGVFIGPEGGFAEEEIALALAHQTEPITLGKENFANGNGGNDSAVNFDVFT